MSNSTTQHTKDIALVKKILAQAAVPDREYYAVYVALNRLLATPEPTQWQDISTAPKDVWFIGRDGNAVYPCTFDEDNKLYVSVVDFALIHGVLPTHWMPLPAPPPEKT